MSAVTLSINQNRWETKMTSSTELFFATRDLHDELCRWTSIEEATSIMKQSNDIHVFKGTPEEDSLWRFFYLNQRDRDANFERLVRELKGRDAKRRAKEAARSKGNENLGARVEKLAEKVNALWYSPDMPGFVSARSRFEDPGSG